MNDKEFNEKYRVYILNHLEMLNAFGAKEQKQIHSLMHSRFKYEVLTNNIIPREIKVIRGGMVFTAVLELTKTPFYKYQVSWEREKGGMWNRILKWIKK